MLRYNNNNSNNDNNNNIFIYSWIKVSSMQKYKSSLKSRIKSESPPTTLFFEHSAKISMHNNTIKLYFLICMRNKHGRGDDIVNLYKDSTYSHTILSKSS